MWFFGFQGGSEGVEERPAGFVGVEQGSDSVVGEVGEPEGCAFDPFDEVVRGLGGGVGDPGGVPVRELGAPGGDGAAQPVDLRRQAGVLEVGGELGDGLGADVGVVDVIDRAQGLFSGAGRRGPLRRGPRRRAGPAAGRGPRR